MLYVIRIMYIMRNNRVTIVKYILTITDSVSCSIYVYTTYIYIFIYINNCNEGRMQTDFLGEIQKIVIL